MSSSQAKEDITLFFERWEDAQRKLARDQRNAVASFINALVKEYEKEVAAYVPRMDALRAENDALTRQIESIENPGLYCTWVDTCNVDEFVEALINADCGLRMDYGDYLLGWHYPRCPKCGRLIKKVDSEKENDAV